MCHEDIVDNLFYLLNYIVKNLSFHFYFSVIDIKTLKILSMALL